jgi:hypothetical protein
VSKKAMNKIYNSIACAIFLFNATVSVKDFKPAFGKWEGTLTYLDYTSGKPYTMPCNITVSKDESNGSRLILAYEYPNEPKANGNDTIVISTDGRMIEDEQVVSKEKENGLKKIITEKNAVDGNDNRKAIIRHIYSIGKKSYSVRKEVKFDGEEKWILRNEYKMSR